MQQVEVKAEPLSVSQLDRWLSGKIPRRILVAPFGGPRPNPYYAKGMDLDAEWFHEGTDFFGPYPALRQSRERLVDWHHMTFLPRENHPAAEAMKGAIMGRVVLDAEPEEVDGFAGLWGDFWANAGEKRRALMEWLEKRGHQLYGSSQPVQTGVVKNAKTGAIDVWPIRFHTISTTPQNTLALVPALKAVLDSPDATEISIDALRALAVDLDNLADLERTSSGQMGERRAKGQVVSLAPIDVALERLRETLRSDR